MNLKPEIILEVANFHGGDTGKIFEVINLYSKLNYDSLGVKFQPFKYDEIALEDFSWFNIYKELFIEEKLWKKIIRKASKHFKSIWLDIFDLYGVNILKQNINEISGIKLQASVLNNVEILDNLLKLDLVSSKIIINVSGYEITEIESILNNYRKTIHDEIILQIGYQGYPTSIEETSLNKIKVLKEAFPYHKLCYADHIDGKSELATIFPSYAYIKGVEVIEKHICIVRADAKYDSYSSLEFREVEKMIDYLEKSYKCLNTEFIVQTEKSYLLNSEQKAICNKKLNKGQLVSKNDVIFRRTEQKGISFPRIQNYQNNYFVLNNKLEKNITIQYKDFKKAKIAVIVACRMKSSRLKQKAIIPINGVPSVERCLYNCSKFSNIDNLILATSTLEEDAILKNYTLAGKAKFWTGDPDDVIKRYLGACEEFNIDVVIRVTADCPVVSSEIAEYLLQSHFETGADYTGPNKYAVGSNSEIYNVAALRRVIELLGQADYSEYMTWYMRNNSHVFKVNIVDLPPEYIRDYRLTLDYPEDLEMFEQLYTVLEAKGMTPDIKNVFKILDANPDIAALNEHLTVKYRADPLLIDKLNRVTRIEIDK